MRSIRSRAPAASSPKVGMAMRRVRRAGTDVETRLRRLLKKTSIIFRANHRPIRGLRIHADFVLVEPRLCIFVDGCFWHGCKTHFKVPHTNNAWWQEKIEDNRKRDRVQSGALRRRGWHVWRVWEHTLAPAHFAATGRRLISRILNLPRVTVG